MLVIATHYVFARYAIRVGCSVIYTGFQSMWVNTEVQNSKMQALLRENLRPDSKKTLPSSSKQLQARPPPGSASRPLVVDSRTGWSQFADFMDKQSDDNWEKTVVMI